jgi:hypothetical protein
VTFDDDRAVAGAGLALVATLSKQLGTYTLANELIDLGAVPGHAIRRKVLTLVDTLRNFAILEAPKGALGSFHGLAISRTFAVAAFITPLGALW